MLLRLPMIALGFGAGSRGGGPLTADRLYVGENVGSGAGGWGIELIVIGMCDVNVNKSVLSLKKDM